MDASPKERQAHLPLEPLPMFLPAGSSEDKKTLLAKAFPQPLVFKLRLIEELSNNKIPLRPGKVW